MNRYGPVVLVVAGILIIAAIGGTVTILDAEIPFSTQSTGAAAKQPTETSSPHLRVTTSSAIVDDEHGKLIRIEAAVENPHDTAVEEVIAVRVDEDRDGTFEMTAGKQSLTVPGGRTVTLNFTIMTSRLGAGTYEYVVETADGTAGLGTGSFALHPAELDIQMVEASQHVVPGEPFELTVYVKNVGDVPGSRSISFSGLGGQADVTRNVALGAGNSTAVTFSIDTTGLEPGYYQYHVTTAHESVSFTARLLRPPGFRVDSVNATTNVTRGTPVRVSVGVTNVGDLPGNRTVTLIGPSDTHNRTVDIAARQTNTLNFTVGTASLEPGNYTYTVVADGPGEQFEVRVRAPSFEVSDLSGTGTYTVGDELTFSAQVRNTGDASGVQQVELRIDVDDDDTPESVGIAKEVHLAPGERTMVTFTIDRERWDDAAPGTSQVGSHIFGIFTDDTNVTGVFSVKSASSGGSGGTADDGQDLVSRDEITQEKYGMFYSAVSEETQTQIDELYTRQPFANGLVVTEVLTREEIAREQFGLDTEPGEPFNFTDLDIQVQQEVEAVFDAQFTSEQGDRIESWDELAHMEYGQPYDQLTAEEQEAIRNAYLEQFDDTS